MCCKHAVNTKGAREKWAVSPLKGRCKAAEGTWRSRLQATMGVVGSGPWSSLELWIFLNQQILKGQLVSRIAGPNISFCSLSLPIAPNSWPLLFFSILSYSSSPHPETHSTSFNTRHLWWQMIPGFKLSELRRKKGVVGEHGYPDGCVVAVSVCVFVCACLYVCVWSRVYMHTCVVRK